MNGDVACYSPEGALPEPATRGQPQQPERDRSGNLTADSLDLLLGGIAVAVLAGIPHHLWRFGAPAPASPRARPNETCPEATAAALPTLAEILAIDDRNAALVELARRALMRAADRTGMRWQTSWIAAISCVDCRGTPPIACAGGGLRGRHRRAAAVARRGDPGPDGGLAWPAGLSGAAVFAFDDAAARVAAGQLIQDRRVVIERLARRGVRVLDARPGEATARLVTAYLETRSRKMP
ncbi:hypothetical protein [uncultured Albimonas sp.]|uniref:hypothetical protein n=1 Tax=uncultured Albimonas sp. TaxID=1331701 RepID=UPI0030ED0A0B